MFKKIACTIGHSVLKNGNITSADGTSKGGVNEYRWCKKFVPILVDEFKNQGVEADCIQCPERQFLSAREEKNYKLNKIHSGGYDLVIESHLNCFNGTAKGTETLYSKGSVKGKEVAQRVNDKLDDIWEDRDIKARDDLYILTQTKPVAILNEYFFCDNKIDYNKADEDHELRLIARKVVEGVLNKTINDIKPPATENTKCYKNCVLYGSDPDRVGAEIIGWAKEDCIVKHVKDHVKWEATNLFTVGGPATEGMQKLNNGEKFGIIKGDNRYDTVRKCLEFVGK